MSTLAVNSITDANAGNTATINGMTPTADSLQGFRNRILNGCMRIDQRNAGATVATTGSFPVDRFAQTWSGVGVLTSKQSTDAPEGFTNSLEVKVTTVDSSIGSTDFYQISQLIEGFNVSDIGLGQSWCKPLVLSFWVKASQTGTYSVQLANNTGNRCYPTTITVNSANAWEYKTISIPATTSGTFLTNNSIGLGLRIGFAYGSNFDGATPNTWGTFTSFGDAFVAPTTNMMATLDATFYITGVQLEVGSVATPFERRPYGTELSLCQRYCRTLDSASGTDKAMFSGVAYLNNLIICSYTFPTMRASPTATITNATQVDVVTGGAVTNANNTLSFSEFTSNSCQPAINNSGTPFTQGHGAVIRFDGAGVVFSAEL